MKEHNSAATVTLECNGKVTKSYQFEDTRRPNKYNFQSDPTDDDRVLLLIRFNNGTYDISDMGIPVKDCPDDSLIQCDRTVENDTLKLERKIMLNKFTGRFLLQDVRSFKTANTKHYVDGQEFRLFGDIENHVGFCNKRESRTIF